MTLYALRRIPKQTDNETQQATVMYSTTDAYGPWYDMAEGPEDYCWEIVEALQHIEELKND